MKRLFILFSFLFPASLAYSQSEEYIASLKRQLAATYTDSNKARLYFEIGGEYLFKNNDSVLLYAGQAARLAEKYNLKPFHIMANSIMFVAQGLNRNDVAALKIFFETQSLVDADNDTTVKQGFLEMAGLLYNSLEDYRTSLKYFFAGAALIRNESERKQYDGVTSRVISEDYYKLNMLDSALVYANTVLHTLQRYGEDGSVVHRVLGNIYRKKGEWALAIKELHKGAYLAKAIDNFEVEVIKSQLGLAQTFYAMGNMDSALYYSNAVLHSPNLNSFAEEKLQTLNLLKEVYRNKSNMDSAFKYTLLVLDFKDSIYNAEKIRTVQRAEVEHTIKNKDADATRLAYRNRVRIYVLIGALLIFSIIALLLWRNNQQRKKAYTLLQLQKQEIDKQKREAEIEAALERVRAKALAMQTSSDLIDVATVLREQMGKLGQPELESCIVHLYNGDSETFEGWYAYSPAALSTGAITGIATVNKNATEWAREVMAKYQSSETEYTIVSRGHKLKEWYKELEGLAPATIEYDDNGQMLIPKVLYYHLSKFSGGALLMISNQEPARESREMQKRAAAVFDLAYTRFLDLQRAEAQAKEAKLETALERVRARAMAMQSSSELGELVALLFQELVGLELILARCIIWIFDPQTLAARLWMANSEDKRTAQSYYIKPLNHTYYQAIVNGWRERVPKWVYDLKGSNKKSIDTLLLTETELSLLPDSVKTGIMSAEHTVVSGSFNNFGFIEASGPVAHTPQQLEILYRFGKVFDLSYTRFNDLKQAEAQAKEAIRQASLDRIRAEIASMRSTKDLERITPLIWKELTIQHVPFIRCGVFIMHEENQQTHVYLSTPDGNAIAAFQLPFNNKGFIEGVLSHWRNNKTFTDHWNASTFYAWTRSLVEQGAIKPDENYSVEKPPEDLYLHFLPFLQGMLYVGNTAPLKEDELSVVQALAEAFSTAYARYEDFNKLDTAKQQVETTLKDLRSAQQQLIQSEKMASLGELTAGIAHEIQNPLNFVNNFSETNVELLTELKQEISKGDIKEVDAIATDVLENEQKINHHGKRADSIVKSMLEHSRTSKGERQATDINALAEEYLRLAYHGFRAKDKSFNTKMETHYDASIGKVSIIPQDIGRVLLNLYNNAFYAVTEKKKQVGDGYEPTVTVSTKMLNNSIEIWVQDNGIGIPPQVVHKVFQPFFTTKPTGEGTGLGLSLSYDIIKAHGGELKVESNKGEGALFSIELPLHQITNNNV